MKPLNDHQYAFKAAVRRAIVMAGGCKAASEDVRADAARLSRYGNIDAPEYAPIDICFDLDKAAGDPVVLRAYADLLGFELVPRDEAADQLARDVTSLAGNIAKESGELVSTAISAASDGKISINDARAIDDEAADLQDKIVDIRAAARKSISKVS